MTLVAGPTQDHEDIKATLREFLDREFTPEYIRDVDREHRFPEEAWQKLSSIGVLGWPIAEEFGGLGGDLLGTVIIVEELCRGFFALGNAYVNSTYAASYSIGLYGTAEQKRSFLPRLARGEIRFAFGFTEPASGQDFLGGIQTRATRSGNEFVLNGQKVFTTHANVSDHIVTIARTTTGGRRSEGLSIFILDADQAGIDIRVLDTIVFHANATCEVYFSDVRVPEDRLLGNEDDGWASMVRTLDVEKIIVAAEAIGNAQAALDYAVRYAQERTAFGGPIGRFQAIQHYVAEAAVRVETARALVHRAAALADGGRPHSYEAMVAKVAASEAGAYTTDVGMRILAGYGYMTEYPMQRYFRDARVFLTGPVTNEMARNQIAEHWGLPRSY